VTRIGAARGEDADVVRDVLSGLLGSDLSELERHGAVRFAGPGLIDLTAQRLELANQATGLAGVMDGMLIPKVAGLTVELTPLGTWALRRALLREEANAPLVSPAPSPATSG